MANTVTISKGRETDLLAGEDEYERWAEAEVYALGWSSLQQTTLLKERNDVLLARASVREVVAALADGQPRPTRAVDELNRLSRAAPDWVELEPASGRLDRRHQGSTAEGLLALYARDALRMVADGAEPLRRCPAPSCGMFYPPSRPQQRWCSIQCGTRARVAHHYRGRRRSPA